MNRANEPEDLAPYMPAGFTEAESAVIQHALAILASKMVARDVLASPSAVKEFCQLKLGACDREVFAVLYLDAHNRLIQCVEEFYGTLTQTSVYPREIVKRALAVGAASVIFTHNHPSGDVKPSLADERLTKVLREALALVDVRVLDHVIVSPDSALSMAEQGLL